MMTKPNSVNVLICGLSVCLLALAASAQPPLPLIVDGDCQTEVPDFIENYEEIFPGFTPPWSGDASLEQFPDPGLLAPGTITEDDWVAALPTVPFPVWPANDMNVYVIATVDDVDTLYVMATIQDTSR
ncbi:MAG TPA: hypothetical protein PKO23_18225, partial [Candidatus Hydrogenedentes bacterium]|nr:hypothetical protein [Candidatus Hydrogenedentota bacterium]